MRNSKYQGNRCAVTRRSVLTSAGALAGLALTPALPEPFAHPARAQGSKNVPFQLSWVKSIQYGGYFAGIENGYYKEAGVDAVFNAGGPGIDAVANVAAGRSVMGDRPSGALIVARDKGIPIKIIGTVFQKSPGSIMSPADKPVRTIKDLAGKTVALPNTARPIVTQLLKDAGVDLASVKMVPVGSDPGILASGQVDAYYGYSTNQGMMLRMRGFKIFVLNVSDAGAPNMAGTIYAREDFLKSNKDTVVGWLRASVRAWDWAMSNPEKTAELMVGKYGAPGLDKAQQLAELKESVEFIKWGAGSKQGLLWIDPALMQKEIDQMRTVGLVKSKMTAADLCDPQYIAAAHKKS